MAMRFALGTLVLVLASCGRVAFDPLEAASWWDRAWSHRVQIFFDNAASTEPLVGFPAVVALTPGRIDYAIAASDGRDVRFVDADGATVLAHEVESWGPTGTSIVWVRVPQIDAESAGDHIWLYFGNPSAEDRQNAPAVWQDRYVGVWHLAESAGDGGTYADSTAQGLDRTFADSDGDSAPAAPAAIGAGLELAGDQDSIDLGDPPALRITGSMTIEAWVKPDLFRSDVPKIVNKLGLAPQRAYRLEISDGSMRPMISLSTDGVLTTPQRQGATPLPTTRLTHLAGVYDAAALTLDLYVDGALDNGQLNGVITSSQFSDNGRSVVIGHRGADGGDLESVDGTLDEVRIANIAHSAAWLNAVARADRFASVGSIAEVR